jgi:hypothetical protein
MKEVLEKLERVKEFNADALLHTAIDTLVEVVKLLAHKVQELEPEQFTEEDMTPLISDDDKRLERDKLVEELCKALHYEYITDKTQMLVDQLRELIDASKEP